MIASIVILVVLGIVFATIYNGIVANKEAVDNSFREIDIALDSRGKKFDSLISAVKKSMSFESDTLEKVVKLRSQIQEINAGGNKNSAEVKNIENELSTMISSGALQKGISIQVEAYPDLKATQNMLQFQEEIVSIEDKLAYAKKGYNASIEEYNVSIKSLFGSMVVKMAPQLAEKYEYWQISEEVKKTEEKRRVSFD
jgi:LemA protein